MFACSGLRRAVRVSIQKQWSSTNNSSGLLRLNRLPPTGTMTKVVCTIGPASDVPAKVGDLVTHGMHVARLNFSHAGSDYTYPTDCMGLVRNAPGKHDLLATGATVGNAGNALPKNLRAILVDTKGPEIRTGMLQSDKDVIEIETDD